MEEIKLYNSLSRKKETFIPIQGDFVGLYTCGPTVYDYAHIGNLRTYIFEDLLKRSLLYLGYRVKHVMNITDVGHLTGDMDMGEDKLEANARRQGKDAWELAAFYTDAFKRDAQSLNILPPDVWCKATDYIREQIDMVVSLEKKGYTYRTDDGMYFDTSKVEGYNKLSHLPLEQLREGARVEKNEQKKNPTDFALWKFSPKDSKRQMEWDSPWGVGFPGWHLECSAMSLANLPGHLDIHCGGIDHLNIHHTNEIAQSEAATGQRFFNYWLHGAFLNIAGGKKMAKSAGNFLTLENALIKEGIAPLAFRFAALQVHYRKPMEYSQESFKQADNALSKLRQQVQALGKETGKIQEELRQKFQVAIFDDLNLPKGLAVLSSVFRAKISDEDKLATVLDFDKVLGLGLDKLEEEELELSKETKDILEKRSRARADKDFAQSDILRDKLLELGYKVKDTAKGQEVERV